jgi:glycine C-acetyltransferase
MRSHAHVPRDTLGGYTSSTAEVATILRQRSRPYLFSNALPPAVVAAASASLDKLMASTDLCDRLRANTAHFRSALARGGFTTKGVDHPIVPIMLGDARLAAEFADDMLQRDIYVIGFSYPVVPVGARGPCARLADPRGAWH